MSRIAPNGTWKNKWKKSIVKRGFVRRLFAVMGDSRFVWTNYTRTRNANKCHTVKSNLLDIELVAVLDHRRFRDKSGQFERFDRMCEKMRLDNYERWGHTFEFRDVKKNCEVFVCSRFGGKSCYVVRTRVFFLLSKGQMMKERYWQDTSMGKIVKNV